MLPTQGSKHEQWVHHINAHRMLFGPHPLVKIPKFYIRDTMFSPSCICLGALPVDLFGAVYVITQ